MKMEMTNGTLNLTIDDMALLYSEQVFLELNATIKDQVWQEIQQQSYPTDAARQNAYRNQLLMRSFLGYLDTDVLPDFKPDTPDIPTIWPSFSESPTIWSWVNGSALDIGPTRLVLIPIEDIHDDEVRIPREWVELPEWVGNFYVAAQVDVDREWIQVLGYATHAQLRQQGHYEAVDETYRLNTDALTDDLSTLWMTYELCQNPRPTVPLSTVSTVSNVSNVSVPPISALTREAIANPNPTIEQRVQSLALTSFSLQRLTLPFEKWAEVVGTAEGRRSLHAHLINKAIGATKVSTQASLASLTDSAVEPTHNLRQWLQNRFDAGWQSLDTLLDQNENRLAMSFRQGPDPVHELTVEGVKLIDMGVQLGHQQIALVIGLLEKADQHVAVRIQLLPTQGAFYLPPSLTLRLMSQSNNVLQTLTARKNDNLMQLKRFTCKEGTRFTIQLTLGTVKLTEAFEVRRV